MLVRDPNTALVGQHDVYDSTYLDFGDASRSTGILSLFNSSLDRISVGFIISEKGNSTAIPIRSPITIRITLVETR